MQHEIYRKNVNSGKNLLKLYLNDVGLLTGILYRNNTMPIMSDERSTNLGSVYETVVAQELRAHGFNLFYYDNKKNGEVDYLIDDFDNMSVAPMRSSREKTTTSTVPSTISCRSKNTTSAKPTFSPIPAKPPQPTV